MRNQTIALLIVFSLVGISLACTIPVNFAPPPVVEEKIVYVEVTSTPEEAEPIADSDETETAGEAAVVPVSMDGPWTIWQGTAEQKLSIDFLQKGSALIGNAATDDGNSMIFQGTISANGKTASGTWESTSGTSGVFQIALNDSLNSFSGNLGGGVPFCGTRMGSSKPYPCLN
jgi:hypothetical protein